MTVAASESQTTPVVTGTDIFSFGSADRTPGPGEGQQEPATPAPTQEGHPGEANQEGGSGKAEGEGREEPAADPAKPRFKDHSSAEEGYRHLQSQATKAQQEAAELRKRIADYEAQQAAKAKEQTDTERQALVDQAVDEYEIDRNKQAMKDIEALDPDDPEHQEKVARIWAACHKDVRKFIARPVGKDGKPFESVKGEAGSVKTEAAADPATESNARSARTSPAGGEGGKTAEEIRADIDTKVRAAGIDPDDELWVGVALTTPEKGADGKRMSVDQQIEWTINRYNERKAAYLARARQETGLPLGEGGSGPKQTTPGSGSGGEYPGPISLGDAIARSNERRRL